MMRRRCATDVPLVRHDDETAMLTLRAAPFTSTACRRMRVTMSVARTTTSASYAGRSRSARALALVAVMQLRPVPFRPRHLTGNGRARDGAGPLGLAFLVALR